MSTFKAKSIWTAFITAFFALLAALGLMGATATAAENGAAEPTTTNQEHTAATEATAATPSVRWALPRDTALPPTMKQRIRAEAHGSSPATRHLSDGTTNTDGTTGTGDAADSHGTTSTGTAHAGDITSTVGPGGTARTEGTPRTGGITRTAHGAPAGDASLLPP